MAAISGGLLPKQFGPLGAKLKLPEFRQWLIVLPLRHSASSDVEKCRQACVIAVQAVAGLSFSDFHIRSLVRYPYMSSTLNGSLVKLAT